MVSWILRWRQQQRQRQQRQRQPQMVMFEICYLNSASPHGRLIYRPRRCRHGWDATHEA